MRLYYKSFNEFGKNNYLKTWQVNSWENNKYNQKKKHNVLILIGITMKEFCIFPTVTRSIKHNIM